MSKGDLGALADFLRRLEGPSAGQGLSDRQLLARFATDGDQAAFATIVQRHGSLVMNVCRRLLRHEQHGERADSRGQDGQAVGSGPDRQELAKSGRGGRLFEEAISFPHSKVESDILFAVGTAA